MGIGDYLSCHPSENNSNIHKIQAVEMWNNWYTVDEITVNQFVSDHLPKIGAEKQPIAAHSAMNNQLHGRKDVASESGMESMSGLASTNALANVNKQTIKDR